MDTGPEARVIASFTVITALLLGAWSPLEHLLSGAFQSLELVRLLVALVPVAATVVAFRSARTADAVWARQLGGAAVMLGVLCSLGGVVHVLVNT
jgi:hypothetical protein